MRKILVIFSLSFALLIGIFAFSSVKAKADTDEIDLQYSYIYFNTNISYGSFAPNTTTSYDITFYSYGNLYTKIAFIRDSSNVFRIRYYVNNSIYYDVYKYTTGWQTTSSMTSNNNYRYLSIISGNDTDNDSLSLFFQANSTITFNAESFREDGYTEGYNDGEFEGYRDGYDDAIYDLGYVNLIDYYSNINIYAFDSNDNLINRAIRYEVSFDTLPLTSSSSIKSLKIYNIDTDSSMYTINITISFRSSFKFESIYFTPLANSISINNNRFTSFTQPLTNLYLCNVESSNVSNSITFVLNAQSYSSINFYSMGYYADPTSMTTAFESGYSIGKDDGIVIGKELGYSEGLNDSNWLGNSLLSVVDIPFKVFQQTFDFNIFGINLYHLVMGFLTLGVVLWFWKKLH